MAEGRDQQSWLHTFSVITMILKVNCTSKDAKELDPWGYYPYRNRSTESKRDREPDIQLSKKEQFAMLKKVFVDGKV